MGYKTAEASSCLNSRRYPFSCQPCCNV